MKFKSCVTITVKLSSAVATLCYFMSGKPFSEWEVETPNDIDTNMRKRLYRIVEREEK